MIQTQELDIKRKVLKQRKVIKYHALCLAQSGMMRNNKERSRSRRKGRKDKVCLREGEGHKEQR